MDITLQTLSIFDYDEDDRRLDDFNTGSYSLEEWFMLSEYFDKGSVKVTVLPDGIDFSVQQLGVTVKSTQLSLGKGSLDFSDSEMQPSFSRKPRKKRQDK